jgi:hypothetical protein
MASAGCQERPYGYYLDVYSPEIVGAPCDPAVSAPFRLDLALAGSGLAAYEGWTVHALVRDTLIDVVAATGTSVVAGGAFEVLLPKSVHPDHPGHVVDVFIDAAGDGACNAGVDPAWRLSVPTSFDIETGRVLVEMTGDAEQSPLACTP